ncbi:uncharacterized protein BDZ99DRAFT_555817 [Mytilinidion resinicola]|uniref:Tat pathway signal sequence n=1 Tax=Mytilinidion resinicola TaxID=574789 RepID=A0A6A6YWD9_9PEZI|nr:uncharacterized protein BDZ99DRAFT_555817 [Mytilinidion resinicola]KAF2812868.1 hypothetical protein BDZ99DRAFT_555817 [Mytilinidion resinicola]
MRHEYASDHSSSKYSGLPNDDNTQAWDDLIMREPSQRSPSEKLFQKLTQPKATFFNTSADELAQVGEEVDNSVRLADGGYIAGLGVYHDIHCLRRLRLFLHSDYYYPPLTEVNLRYLRKHLDHCIESLRKAVMCNVDTNIYTFTWDDTTAADHRPNPKSNQMRKCTNWEAVEGWVTKRHVPLNPMLMRPSGVSDRIHMV